MGDRWWHFVIKLGPANPQPGWDSISQPGFLFMAKKIEFELPKDLTLPDQISSNGEFDALATIKIKKDGKACLVAIDGYRMPGYREEDEQESEQEEMEEDSMSYSEAASEGME